MRHREQEDKRINAKRPFWKEYLIILVVILISNTGSILIFSHQMQDHSALWQIVLDNIAYVLFIVFIVKYVIRYISYTLFTKPLLAISQAARIVARGDFTVRVHSQRKDNKKDELEVLIDDFNVMVEELATIETLKTDFIANVSHEIKTPLAIIQSYAAALLKDELSHKEKQQYIDVILEASKKLSSLVTNILRLNKLENQEIIQSESYSLDEQIRCCILALEDKFEEKNVELDVDLDEAMVTTDESLMEIVWNNLLTNAIKFTEPGGMIKVELKKDFDKIIAAITDTGCGMSEETVRRIFDRFYQGDTSHSTEGNGLGLSLVKRVIDLVEGKISVESKPGKGTKFTVIVNSEK